MCTCQGKWKKIVSGGDGEEKDVMFLSPNPAKGTSELEIAAHDRGQKGVLGGRWE